jgi:hypothetical protein
MYVCLDQLWQHTNTHKYHVNYYKYKVYKSFIEAQSMNSSIVKKRSLSTKCNRLKLNLNIIEEYVTYLI